MASVTHRVQNYLGGVSKQPDDKKFPGQVREALNAYPDATFGLQKRPGLKFLTSLKDATDGTAFSGTSLDNGKWFYIHRDNDEKYIGCILGNATAANAAIHIWNATADGNGDYVKCAVTATDTNKAYLSATTKDDYHILTVQDTSIITNKQKTITTQADPTYNNKRRATVRLLGIDYSANYNVTITIGGVTHTPSPQYKTYNADTLGSNASTDTKLNADAVLTGIKAKIDGLSISGLTVTKLTTTLEITHSSDFIITVEGGVDGKQLSSYQDSVNNVSELPTEGVHGRVVKIINTANAADTYYAKFVTNAGSGTGPGYWEETLGHGMSAGLTASTMPHELVNTGTNAFTFRPITWTDRLVGDNTTNAHPSFTTKTIQQSFFYNNRLGFLSEDNVAMSQSGEFYNFYHITAQTISAADPVDINCSSIRPAVLHGIIPVASGLILFSENQQFIMYSADGNLTPTTAIIRGLSNYEMDTKIDPVDVGTNINFVSKTPAYTRVFSMTPRGEGQIPEVTDIGKVVSEYIPETVDSLIASAQNSFIAMYGATKDLMYFYRTHTEGNEQMLKAWFSWKLPGNILEAVVDSDVLYTIIKQSNGYYLLSANLSATPEDEILVTQSGVQINPYMDMYSKASNVTYDSATRTSKCYIPYTDITSLEPVIVIAGGADTADSGFTITPGRGSDGTGPYFSIVGKDFSANAIKTKVIVGYKYNYDITLPKTYFQLDKGITDYSATLTIARMKFSVGRSSTIGFKLKSNGYQGSSQKFTGDGSNKIFSPTFTVQDKANVIVKKNGEVQTLTTDYTIANHATLSNHVTVTFVNAPAAATTAANVTTAADSIEIYIDNWYDIQPVQEANLYLADDVPMSDQNVYTVPVHQRTDNFLLRVFSDSPFPVSLTSMMWEGNYSPRYYRRS